MAKILIVDGSEVIGRFLSDYLRDMGHEVDMATDSRQGVIKALTDDYGLIFCDLHMPRKSGRQVYQEISAVKPRQEFIMTDSCPDRSCRALDDIGTLECVAKPFDLEEVKVKLEKALTAADSSR